MEKINPQQVDEIRSLLAANPSIRADADGLWNYLPDCEYELILFMVSQKVWQGPVPAPPDGFQPGDGSIELGLFRYWAQYPDELDLKGFKFDTIMAIYTLCFIIDEKAPASQMTITNANFFATNELIYIDGGVLSTEKFATYDQGWFIAFLNLVESLLHSLWYNGGVLPSLKPPVIPLSGSSSNVVNIALLGDWGTADGTAKAVMDRVYQLNPDYIVHVGDVYYSGSPAPSHSISESYFSAGEEVNRLVNVWPTKYTGRSFTLNSNHEMYSGANGYYLDALSSPNPAPGVRFVAQAGSSFFALQYGGWTILGLDSAFMGTSIDAFMTGTIGGAGGAQGKWISGLNLDPQKVIVLTHHNGFASDTSYLSSLWNEINGALNGDPYAWYWGHVHYGIAYNSPITIPSIPGQPGLTTKTFARCLGHGALPYGLASSLNGKPVAWSSNKMQPPPSKQLYNGFAMLTLTSSAGKLTSITENFYDLSGTSAVWTKKIY